MWTGRIILESAHTPLTSSFVTLTYNEEYVPKDGSLVPGDLDTFINRLRNRSGIGYTRYFSVGEYGDISGRPHFHLALFGIPPSYSGIFESCWHKDGEQIGYIHTGEITKDSAAYIAGYATKRLTNKDDPRLNGRYPEFARQSRRPPIGATGIRHIENMMYTRAGAYALAHHGDVPASFNIAGNNYPIGRYWRNWLRQRLNITNPPVNSSWELDYETFTKEREKSEKVATKLWQTSRRLCNAKKTI